MKTERISIKACCGKSQIVFRLFQPISLALLEFVKSHNFHEQAHFTKAGVLYADNLELIVIGSFGTDKLQVKCKKDQCDQILADFEALLQTF